jgi:Asp-tRNA(Asn)/Glu-tRNA(Gln) amidotransferase A subunit family amidase
MDTETARVPAWQIAAGIRDRQFSSYEVIEAHLRQIERLKPAP